MIFLVAKGKGLAGDTCSGGGGAVGWRVTLVRAGIFGDSFSGGGGFPQVSKDFKENCPKFLKFFN